MEDFLKHVLQLDLKSPVTPDQIEAKLRRCLPVLSAELDMVSSTHVVLTDVSTRKTAIYRCAFLSMRCRRMLRSHATYAPLRTIL